MNFLGHFIISYPDPGIAAGNIMGEFRHGTIRNMDYPEEILQGMELHRTIDSFTDQSPNARKIADFFRPRFGKYAPVISDIALDYFIAQDASLFPEEKDLQEFAREVYSGLSPYEQHFEEDEKAFLNAMRSQDWLSQYRFLPGIKKSFSSLISRSQYLENGQSPEDAIAILEENKDAILPYYEAFKEELKETFPDSAVWR